MTILVDADACPVKSIIERLGVSHGIPVVFLIDSNHVLTSATAAVVVVGSGRDAVDFALISRTQRGDVVVTQDYGVAAMALGKGAHVLDQNGRIFTDANIDLLLHERWLSSRARRGGSRGPRHAKRTTQDDDRFEIAFRGLLRMAGEETGTDR